MEIDQSKAEERDEESGPEAATPDRSTDDETEDEGEGAASSVQQTKKESAETSETNASVAQIPKVSHTRAEPPPRRELPFGRPATRSKGVIPPPTDEAEDTEDEL